MPARGLEPSSFETFTSWLVALITALELTPKQLSTAAGLSILVCDRLLAGRRPAPRTVTALAQVAGVNRAALARLVASHISERTAARSLAAAIERKRVGDGLTHGDVIVALRISSKGYWNLRHRHGKVDLDLCMRVAVWLGVPVEQVLGWEDQWDRFSIAGRMMVPAMTKVGLTQQLLADRARVHRNTIDSVLFGRHRPNKDVLERIAVALNLNVVELQHATDPQKFAARDRVLKDLVKQSRSVRMQVVHALYGYLRHSAEPTPAQLRERAATVAKRRGQTAKYVSTIWRPYIRQRGLRMKGGRTRLDTRATIIEQLLTTWPRDADDGVADGFWDEALNLVRAIEGPNAPASKESLRQWWAGYRRARP